MLIEFIIVGNVKHYELIHFKDIMLLHKLCFIKRSLQKSFFDPCNRLISQDPLIDSCS